MFDPADRRYRYPITNCGPRFTITRAVPYDRAVITMAAFTMCAACQREYDNPLDHRFHAQPNACPVCGPRVQLLDGTGRALDTGREDGTKDPIARTARLLRDGAVVAVKGLGGYHLACDPFNTAAVRALRGRKVRQDKPFALGAIWDGGFLEDSITRGFARRRGHLEYAPLPGGEAAVRQPWRMALARLIALYSEDETVRLPLPTVQEAGERNVRLVARLLEHGLNTPPTSSAGRLFDAVAALVDVPGSRQTTYEGQAAVELEVAAATPTRQSYPFQLRPRGEGPESGGRAIWGRGRLARPGVGPGTGEPRSERHAPPDRQFIDPGKGEPWVAETGDIIVAVDDDVLTGRPVGEIAARFHRARWRTSSSRAACACARRRAAADGSVRGLRRQPDRVRAPAGHAVVVRSDDIPRIQATGDSDEPHRMSRPMDMACRGRFAIRVSIVVHRGPLPLCYA